MCDVTRASFLNQALRALLAAEGSSLLPWLAFAMFCVFPSILMTCWRYQERTKAAEAHRKELEAAQEVRVRCATVPFRARSTSLELVEEFASMPEPWQNSQTPYHRV